MEDDQPFGPLGRFPDWPPEDAGELSRRPATGCPNVLGDRLHGQTPRPIPCLGVPTEVARGDVRLSDLSPLTAGARWADHRPGWVTSFLHSLDYSRVFGSAPEPASAPRGQNRCGASLWEFLATEGGRRFHATALDIVFWHTGFRAFRGHRIMQVSMLTALVEDRCLEGESSRQEVPQEFHSFRPSYPTLGYTTCSFPGVFLGLSAAL